MTKIQRKFKYKADQKGIAVRYLREKENWQPHLINSKNFILKSAKSKNKKVAVVLGSGWWLDVPAEELSKLFETIYLVDIIHPKEIVHKARKYPNIKFIETDITGQTENIFELVKNYKKTKSKINLLDLQPQNTNFGLPENVKPDFIVSINLLNQLDILITSYLWNHNIYTEQEISKFQKKIQQNHINSLQENKTCLITDYKELNFDNKKNLTEEKQLVFVPFPKGKFEQEWTWKFDLTGNYNKNSQTIFKVKAIDL